MLAESFDWVMPIRHQWWVAWINQETKKILSSVNRHEKEYVVTVYKEITDDLIADLSNEVPMLSAFWYERPALV